MDDLIGKGLDIITVSKLLFFASANLVPLALPLATLLASIMTFGNFSENYELVSLKSAGISLLRAMRPLILVSFFIGFNAFIFTNYVWPVANLKMKTLLFDITHKKPALDIKEKVFYKEIEGYVIRVNKKGNDGQTIYGVTIYDHTANDGNNKIIKADSGKMQITKDEKYLMIDLFYGSTYEELKSDNAELNNFPLFRSSFKEEKILFDMSSFALTKSDEELFKDSYEMMNLKQLQNEIDSAKKQEIDNNKKFGDLVKTQMQVFNDTLFKSKTEALKQDTFWFEKLNFQKKNVSIQNAINMARNAKNYTEASRSSKESNQANIRRLKIEWHRKFTVAFICIVLFFVGAPLGAIIRKGGFGLPVMTSILFFMIYYVISIIGEKLVRGGEWQAFEGMWMAPLILTPIAFFLTYKASVDAKLFTFPEFLKRKAKQRFGDV